MRLVQIIHRHVRFHTLAPGAHAVYGSTGVCPILGALYGRGYQTRLPLGRPVSYGCGVLYFP